MAEQELKLLKPEKNFYSYKENYSFLILDKCLLK